MDMRELPSARTCIAILMAGVVVACADAPPGNSLTSVVVTAPLAVVRATLPDGHTGIAYQGGLRASGGQPPFAWSVVTGALPRGMTLASNGALTGAPLVAGIATFGAKVTDGVGSVADAVFTLRVATLLPLTIATTTLPAASLQAHYQTSLSSTGGAPPFTWARRSGSLPPGVVLGSGGTLSGIPTVAGTYAFGVEVQGSFGQNASRTISLVVNGGPLTIVTRLVKAARGVPSSETLVASGGTQPWTWSLPAGAPAWLTLSGAGVLTIAATTSGTFPVTVRLRDAVGATTTASLTVVVARRVAIVSGPPTDGTVGAPYSFAFAASEGPTPYVFSRRSGALPPGLTLSGAGVLSGTPTTPGSYAFGVQVKALDGTTDTASYTVTIASPPQIVFSTLPTARAGVIYNVTLTAQRGRTPYQWTLLSGPAGLSLVSSSAGTRLTGTLVVAGQYTVVLRVTDASGAFDQRAFTLTVI